jgi:hypothetical protein
VVALRKVAEDVVAHSTWAAQFSNNYIETIQIILLWHVWHDVSKKCAHVLHFAAGSSGFCSCFSKMQNRNAKSNATNCVNFEPTYCGAFGILHFLSSNHLLYSLKTWNSNIYIRRSMKYLQEQQSIFFFDLAPFSIKPTFWHWWTVCHGLPLTH